MSLCYRVAYRKYKANKITEAEYFHHILQHATTDFVKHKGDDELHNELANIDPLGYQLHIMIHNACNTVNDSTPLENVFLAYRTDSPSLIASALAAVPEDYQHGMLTALALFALQERNASVLKWLLDQGASWNNDEFEDEVRRVNKGEDKETWKVVRESGFEPAFPWKKTKKGGTHHPLA